MYCIHYLLKQYTLIQHTLTTPIHTVGCAGAFIHCSVGYKLAGAFYIGESGERGETGPVGDTGSSGLPGSKGSKGDTGDNGRQGQKGGPAFPRFDGIICSAAFILFHILRTSLKSYTLKVLVNLPPTVSLVSQYLKVLKVSRGLREIWD